MEDSNVMRSVSITLTKECENGSCSMLESVPISFDSADSFQDCLEKENEVESRPKVTMCDHSTDESGWSDLETDDDDATEQSFETFAKNHSSNELFKKHKTKSASIPRAVVAKLARTSTYSDIDDSGKSVSAPDSPHASPEAGQASKLAKKPNKQSSSNLLFLSKAVHKEALVRSRSLEGHHKSRDTKKDLLIPEIERKLSFKKKLFKSMTALDKPPFHKEQRRLRKSDPSSGLDQSDGSNHKLPPMLKLFKPSSKIAVWKPQSKGSIDAVGEFSWTTNNNDKSNNPSDSAGKLIGSGLPAVTSAGPAGLLLVESPIQASSSSLLGASSSDIMPGAVGNYDVVDGSPAINEQQRNKQLTEHLKQKIIKTSEAIKAEQSTRDENVAEYLKLATNADRQQASRIKIVFEKKNQKSNNSISQLQKKLDSYHRRLKELESNGTARPGRLRDVGANIQGVVDTVKGGLSGLQHATQNIAHKPKDLASKWKNRFGSADNLSTLKDDDETEDQLLRSGSADDVSSASGSTDNFASIGPEGLSMDDTPNHGRTPSASGADSPTSGIGHRVDAEQIRKVATQLLTIKSELQETRKTQRELELEWERKRNELQSTITQLLEEERMRFEVQVNDLTEMQQREVANLKQELSSMEEKIEYHANERARDVQEALESCQTRIAKMELQQQQLVSVSVEGLENQNAKALLGKLINLLLSVMAVLLVLVSTVSGLLMPFVKSQRRLLATVIVAITFVVIYNNWSYFVSWYDVLVGR